MQEELNEELAGRLKEHVGVVHGMAMVMPVWMYVN